YGAVSAAFHDYSWLDVKGKRVLDVGASIGDTAIYFALRGAEKVVAFEPYPFAFSLAKKNVERNGIANVVLLNAAVGGTDSVVRVTSGEAYAGTALKPFHEGVEVPIYSLDRVIEEYGPFDAVKMDCEGCEYDAILNSRRIGEVGQMQIEYHRGPKKVADAIRRAGFQVTVERSAGYRSRVLGYVYASKRR
ncbi:MAG: FkbM family methyltransferase, partial [Thermoprotei archaeon]